MFAYVRVTQCAKSGESGGRLLRTKKIHTFAGTKMTLIDKALIDIRKVWVSNKTQVAQHATKHVEANQRYTEAIAWGPMRPEGWTTSMGRRKHTSAAEESSAPDFGAEGSVELAATCRNFLTGWKPG